MKDQGLYTVLLFYFLKKNMYFGEHEISMGFLCNMGKDKHNSHRALIIVQHQILAL